MDLALTANSAENQRVRMHEVSTCGHDRSVNGAVKPVASHVRVIPHVDFAIIRFVALFLLCLLQSAKNLQLLENRRNEDHLAESSQQRSQPTTPTTQQKRGSTRVLTNAGQSTQKTQARDCTQATEVQASRYLKGERIQTLGQVGQELVHFFRCLGHTS